MKLKLNKLEFRDFKGAIHQVVNFGISTTIKADNAVGKTRILDAYLWLLFGKDSQGKSDFEIKPIGKNEPYVEVEGTFTFNGENLTLMRVLKENWVKKRGSLEEKFTGNETFYYINGLNMKKIEFDSYVSDIIDIDTFRLLSEPLYFESLHWTERRKLVMSLVPAIDDNLVASGNIDFENLLSKIRGVELQKYKAQIATKARETQNEIKLIKAKIEENNRKLSITTDFETIRTSLIQAEKEIMNVRESMKSSFKAHEQQNEQRNNILKQISSEKYDLMKLEGDLTLEYNKKYKSADEKRNYLNDSLKMKNDNLEMVISSLTQNADKFDELTKEKERLISQFDEISERVFFLVKENTTCPTCGSELPSDSQIIADKKTLFYDNKQIELDSINRRGKDVVSEIGSLSEKKKTLQQRKKEIQSAISDINKEFLDLNDQQNETIPFSEYLESSEDYKKISEKLNYLNENLPEEKPFNDDLKDREILIQNDIDKLKDQLQEEKEIQSAKLRIKELENQISEKKKAISEFEKDIILIEKFVERKIDMIEGPINEKFSLVKFKLYEKLIDGSKEACITTINDVPYHSANYASRINSGLEIINVFGTLMDIKVPVFIDNRESISEIVPMNTQIINLEKVEGQKTLLIENN